MTINVNPGNGSYDIVIKSGVLSEIGKLIDLNRKVLVVTDDGVPAEYAKTVSEQCGEAVTVCLPHGEVTKSFDSFKYLLSVMLEHSFTRRDCVIAVGGGVMGDLSGFSASCYMRGIDFYNVPTTLLSQVDSSVGGKTAIDFGGVKNIVGSFYQPKKVIIDPSTLRTLAPRELHAGLVEAIKMACTFNSELFQIIENSKDLSEDLPEIIHRSLLIKKDVVEKDATEKGLRRVLNFGHTIGHAIESSMGGTLLHGECVALGMLPMSGDAVRERLKKVLEKYSLPTEITNNTSELLPYITHDKKMTADGVYAVFCEEIGTYEVTKVKAEDLIERLQIQ